jgi:hypothetical protein
LQLTPEPAEARAVAQGLVADLAPQAGLEPEVERERPEVERALPEAAVSEAAQGRADPPQPVVELSKAVAPRREAEVAEAARQGADAARRVRACRWRSFSSRSGRLG